MEFRLFQQIGETAETLPEFEELQNIKERLVTLSSRLHNILLRITQSQPTAANDMLDCYIDRLSKLKSRSIPVLRAYKTFSVIGISYEHPI
jgi:hypothetical protein